jgi:hypothetical protein
MTHLIIVALALLAAFVFTACIFLVRRLLAYLAEQTARHRSRRLQRYSLAPFRGTKGGPNPADKAD